MLNAFKGGFSSALAWIKSLPSQAVQWGKNLIQSFINGLTGKGGAVGAGATRSHCRCHHRQSRQPGTSWSSVWAYANASRGRQRPDRGGGRSSRPIPSPGTPPAKAARESSKAQPHRPPRSCCGHLQDAGHTDTTNALGKVTIQHHPDRSPSSLRNGQRGV